MPTEVNAPKAECRRWESLSRTARSPSANTVVATESSAAAGFSRRFRRRFAIERHREHRHPRGIGDIELKARKLVDRGAEPLRSAREQLAMHFRMPAQRAGKVGRSISTALASSGRRSRQCSASTRRLRLGELISIAAGSFVSFTERWNHTSVTVRSVGVVMRNNSRQPVLATRSFPAFATCSMNARSNGSSFEAPRSRSCTMRVSPS